MAAMKQDKPDATRADSPTDPPGPASPYLTPAVRAAAGKAARAIAPLSSLAEWEAPSDRPEPVALLEKQAETRVPELVPVRYGRMLVSPFTFYRGSAAIMASDLARTPVSGFNVQACGDAYLSNFGLFGSPERSLLFDINDFDETLSGPWEWDVKRLAASLTIAALDRGFKKRLRREIVTHTMRQYREAMRSFAGMRTLDVWYARMDLEAVVKRWRESRGRKIAESVRGLALSAQTKDSMKAFSKLTRMVDGAPRFVSDPPLVTRLEEI